METSTSQIVVAGRYRVIESLGGGAQGSVWRVLDLRDNATPRALKWTARGPAARREAEALFRVEHPSLPRALDFGEDAGRAWLVMTCIEGSPLTPSTMASQVIAAGACVAAALAALHDAGLVHGDVKPTNVLVHDECAWLVDLGLTTPSTHYATETVGTLRYLAPELLAGERGPAADLFALGVTLVECLSGEHPFVRDANDRGALLMALASRAAPRADVLARVPEALRASLAWLLEHDPERRPTSARQWITRWCRDAGITPPEGAELRDEVPPARVALVAREAERDVVVRTIQSALRGDEGAPLGVLVTGAQGAGRRRVVEEALRTVRIEAVARGASPEVSAELPDEVLRATIVVMIDADDEAIARTTTAIARTRRYGPALAPVVLLATCTGAVDNDALRQVHLHPLERAKARELLVALHGAPVPSSCVDAWIDATAGLPGRITSIAAVLGTSRLASVSREALFDRAAAWHRAPPRGDLDASELRIIIALGIVGGHIARALIVATSHDAPRALASLVAKDLCVVRGDDVIARGAIALDTWSADEVSAVAQELTDVARRVAPTSWVVRARAAIAARGAPHESWSLVERATNDPKVPRAQALALLERAREIAPDRGAWALRMARVLLRAGEVQRALSALDEAPTSPEARAIALDAMRRAGQRERARALAAELSSSNDPRARLVGHIACVRDALDQGNVAEAARLADALYGVDTAHDGSLEQRAAEVEALVALAQGDLERAHERVERADDLALTSGDDVLRARVQAMRGMLAQREGDHDAARRAYRDAWAFACKAGEPHAAATYLANLGSAELECGALGEALRCLTRASSALTSLGRIADLSRALANVASLQSWIGDRGAARDAARRAMAAAVRASSSASAMIDAAKAPATTSPTSSAAAGLVDAAQRLANAGDPTRADEARARAASRYVRLGLLEAATAVLDAVREPGALVALARCELLMARHVCSGELDAALDVARAAVVAERTAEHDVWLLRVEAAAASVRGDVREASQRRAALDARVRALAATLPADRARAFVEQALLPSTDETEITRDVPTTRDVRRWQRMVTITQRLNDEPRLRTLLELVMDATVELTGASRGFLLLAADDGTLRIRTARNLEQRDLAGEEMSFSRSVAEQVARTGVAMVTVDASSDGRFNTATSVAAMQLRSILAIPLRVHGEVVGTIYVDDRLRTGAFGDDEVAVAGAFADTAAVAIHNARARAALRRALRRAERLSEELGRRVDAQRVELDSVRQTLARDSAAGRHEGIVGRGTAMTRLLGLVDRVAPTGMSVLLRGESGSGKELVARAIHATSARASKPFVAENCGAIPETLLESVLFGHVRGAFTGADRTRAGLFEVADGGTLFLDEVGEMSSAMQAKLLRVLQDGEVRAVGGDRARKVDVRVIAATHRDLAEMVRKGSFREDLYYRLAVMVLPVPSLRERREDIPALVAHFLSRHAPAGMQIDRRAMARLCAAPWPGNVRQLENEIRRAAALADGIIREDELNPELCAIPSTTLDAPRGGNDLKHAVEDVERELVERALREHGWNQSRAARALGLSRFGLQKKLKRLGIPSRDPRTRLRLVK